MKYTQAEQGRVFILRLEDGEIVHETIENFAREQSITAASLIVIGGAGEGSKLVVGPEDGQTLPITPMTATLDETHEIAGTGTLFPDEDGHPTLHVHMACGRNGKTTTGCIRAGVKVWKVMEVVIFELTGVSATRNFSSELGFRTLAVYTPGQTAEKILAFE